MNKFFLAPALMLAFSSMLYAPAFATTGPDLPAKVRAMLPRGATSFLCERLPIGPAGTKALVHVWGSVRPSPRYGYSQYRDSPFCIDVFLPVQDEKKHWSWNLASSASYMDSDAPRVLVPHWLQSAKKQGPILEVISSSGAPGVSTTHRLFTWDDGFQEGSRAPTPQEFGSGGSGGGLISRKFDQVDKRGYMTVVTTNSFGSRILDVTTQGWNGERFVTTSTKRWNWNGKPLAPGAKPQQNGDA